MMLATTDYGQIGTALALVVIAFLQVWNNRKQQATAKTVDDVHTLVNSQMGAQKKLLYDVSAAKAAITHSPLDQHAADIALLEWQAHEAKQKIVDSGNKTQLTASEGQKPDNA